MTLRDFATSCWRGRLNGLLTLARGGGRAAGRSWFSVSLNLQGSARAFAAGLDFAVRGWTALRLQRCRRQSAEYGCAGSVRPAHRRRYRWATVAIASVDGAPTEVSARFRQSLDEAALARRIAVVAPAKAHYLVRGYLTASLIEGGAEIDIVWDVFTQDKQRAQRLSDAIAVKGSGDDAWAMVDDAALNSVAAKCADDLAAYLSNTPEAVPASAALSYAQ